jgi:hypothetical protein
MQPKKAPAGTRSTSAVITVETRMAVPPVSGWNRYTAA